MADFPTRAELFQIGADEMIARSAARPPGSRVNPEEIFTEGSDINMVIAAGSAMCEEAVRHNAVRIADLYLESSEGVGTDRLIADRFSPTVVRLEASAALVDLQLSQVGGGPAQVFPVGTRARTVTGVEFRTLVAVTIAATATGPVTVRAQAVQTGPSGNVDLETITALVSPREGVSVTNPARASGGDDIEPSGRLKNRAKGFFIAARRGTIPAIEFGAKTVPGVRLATVIESVDSLGDQTGHVQVYISDAVGSGNAALAELVELALYEYRAAGIVPSVFGATPVFQPIQLRLRYATNVDSTLAFDAVRRRVLAAVNRLNPQQTLERSIIIAAARTVAGVLVLDDAVVVPAGDVVPAAGELIRTTLPLITAAV